MKKDNLQPVDWTPMLVNHRNNCEGTTKILERLESALEEDGDITPVMCELKQLVQESEDEAQALCQTLFEKPVRLIMSLKRMDLTEQQYYLLRAAGVVLPTAKRLGISPVDDHEIYRQCVYEDQKMVWFMDPDEKPVTKSDRSLGEKGHITVRVRFSMSPEECHLEHFRPDQKEFWAKHRPDVLARCIGATSGTKTCEDGA